MTKAIKLKVRMCFYEQLYLFDRGFENEKWNANKKMVILVFTSGKIVFSILIFERASTKLFLFLWFQSTFYAFSYFIHLMHFSFQERKSKKERERRKERERERERERKFRFCSFRNNHFTYIDDQLFGDVSDQNVLWLQIKVKIS